MDWTGKVSVVTGAANGIGRALARELGRRGGCVVLADRDAAALRDAESELGAQGVDALAVHTDVTRRTDVEALVGQAMRRHGRIDLLFNNAGVASGRRAWEYTEADWHWQLGVNLLGPAHAIRAVVPIMLYQGSGHVVNVASAAGLVCAPGMAAYNAGKHALVALSETLQHELRMQSADVGVSVVCPAWVDTRIWDSERYRPAQFRNPGAPAAPSAQVRDALAKGLPPQEVAQQILDGVAERRFYILPSPRVADAFLRRAQLLRDSGAAFDPMAGPSPEPT